jgi:hypothetical protein
MGAWGAGPFDNDDAGDFVWDLADESALDLVRAALAAVDGAEVEAPEGSIALAAAEVVAAARGAATPDLPEELALVVAALAPEVTDDDAARALAAVRAVGGPGSELADLWSEAGGEDEAAWRGALADLGSRLSGS